MSAQFLLGVPGKLKTLLDRLTATRAGYLDNLDATISSRTSASIWTGTKAGYLDAAISSRLSSAIASVQTGYVSSNTGSGSGEDTRYADVTISSVDTSKSVVIVHNQYGDSLVSGRLTSSTNLRLAVNISSWRSCRWYVVEFN